MPAIGVSTGSTLRNAFEGFEQGVDRHRERETYKRKVAIDGELLRAQKTRTDLALSEEGRKDDLHPLVMQGKESNIRRTDGLTASEAERREQLRMQNERYRAGQEAAIQIEKLDGEKGIISAEGELNREPAMQDALTVETDNRLTTAQREQRLSDVTDMTEAWKAEVEAMKAFTERELAGVKMDDLPSAKRRAVLEGFNQSLRLGFKVAENSPRAFLDFVNQDDYLYDGDSAVDFDIERVNGGRRITLYDDQRNVVETLELPDEQLMTDDQRGEVLTSNAKVEGRLGAMEDARQTYAGTPWDVLRDRAAGSGGSPEEDKAERIRERNAVIRKEVTGMLKNSIAKGDDRSSVDPDEIAFILENITRRDPDGQYSAEELIAAFATHNSLLDEISAKAGTRRMTLAEVDQVAEKRGMSRTAILRMYLNKANEIYQQRMNNIQ